MGTDGRPVCSVRFAPRACIDLAMIFPERNPCMQTGRSCMSRPSDGLGIRASMSSGLTWEEDMGTGHAGSGRQTQNHGSVSGRGRPAVGAYLRGG